MTKVKEIGHIYQNLKKVKVSRQLIVKLKTVPGEKRVPRTRLE